MLLQITSNDEWHNFYSFWTETRYKGPVTCYQRVILQGRIQDRRFKISESGVGVELIQKL